MQFDDWVSQDRRRVGPHVDFGTRWIDPERPERYQRVSWIPKTGELYATDGHGSYVRLLGIVSGRLRVEAILSGWTTACAEADPPLAWVEDRVMSALLGSVARPEHPPNELSSPSPQ